MMTNEEKKFQWGRSRFNGIPTMRIAIPVGVALALAYSLLSKIGESQGEPLWWIGGLLLGAFLSPFGVALVAVLIVDRSTMEGVERNPEASIESTWADKAASQGFYATLGACGIGSMASQWLKHEVVSYALIGVAAFMAASFCVAYLVQKWRS